MKEQYTTNSTVVISLIVSVVFVAGIYLVSLTLGRFQCILLPDAGAAWYYWKLPNISLWATISAWGLYAAHQLFVWILAAKLRKQPLAPKGTISKTNLQLLIVNAIFILLHMLQTTFFYDGLAQNVPIMSSQGSVIAMLVMVLILLVSRRGLFFGKKVPLPKKGTNAVFQIHGIFISWAVIYTFWFHPTEGTTGHLLGFFYIFMLMIQISLAQTRFHNNIKWVTLLEVYVAIHGAIVAIEAGNNMWPMFLFGFLMMFIVTQVYGLTSNRVAISGVIASYVSPVLLTYSGVLGNPHTFSDIHQITWIPAILYALVFALVWLLQGVMILFHKTKLTNIPKNLNT